MRAMFEKGTRLFLSLCRAAAILLFLVYFLMVGAVSVFPGRIFLSSGLEELIYYFQPFLLLVGGILAVRNRQKPERKGRKWKYYVFNFLVMAAFSYLGISAFYLRDLVGFYITPVLGISHSWIYAGMFLGCLGVVIQTVINLICIWKGKMDGEFK